jgi:hypothetical protein
MLQAEYRGRPLFWDVFAMFRVVAASACIALALSAASSAAAGVVFQIPLADGTKSTPGINYNWNGNCWFQCGSSNETYAASHIVLSSSKTFNHLDFIGILSWNPAKSNHPVTVSWVIYKDDGSFKNSSDPSPLGTIFRLGGPVAAQFSSSIVHSGQIFQDFSVDLPMMALPAGKYFLALHATILNTTVQTRQAIYWANGYGDGHWAWNMADNHTEWVNPIPTASFGGNALTLSNTLSN